MASWSNNVFAVLLFVAVTILVSEVHLTSSLPHQKDSGIIAEGKYTINFSCSTEILCRVAFQFKRQLSKSTLYIYGAWASTGLALSKSV